MKEIIESYDLARDATVKQIENVIASTRDTIKRQPLTKKIVMELFNISMDLLSSARSYDIPDEAFDRICDFHSDVQRLVAAVRQLSDDFGIFDEWECPAAR